MTPSGKSWGSVCYGVSKPPLHAQQLPLPCTCNGVNSWQYLALARCYRKWCKANGYGPVYSLPAYKRWCAVVNLPFEVTDGALGYPGYSLL